MSCAPRSLAEGLTQGLSLRVSRAEESPRWQQEVWSCFWYLDYWRDQARGGVCLWGSPWGPGGGIDLYSLPAIIDATLLPQAVFKVEDCFIQGGHPGQPEYRHRYHGSPSSGTWDGSSLSGNNVPISNLTIKEVIKVLILCITQLFCLSLFFASRTVGFILNWVYDN